MLEYARAHARTHTNTEQTTHTQIEYVMCDKTGTLTQNQMIFRQCSVGGRIYTDPLSGELGTQAEHNKCMKTFLRLLAACNEVRNVMLACTE
jgi:P-type E1-E2 ATPase